MRYLRRICILAPILVLCLSGYGSGSQTVTTAGTIVQLSTTGARVSILTIQAKSTNTGTIWVGGSNVSAASKIGVALGPPITAGQPGGSVAYNPQGNAPAYNLSEFWLDATNGGDGVTYAWK